MYYGVTGVDRVDTLYFSKKTNLASLILDIDELNIGKLKTVPIDLEKEVV